MWAVYGLCVAVELGLRKIKVAAGIVSNDLSFGHQHHLWLNRMSFGNLRMAWKRYTNNAVAGIVQLTSFACVPTSNYFEIPTLLQFDINTVSE